MGKFSNSYYASDICLRSLKFSIKVVLLMCRLHFYLKILYYMLFSCYFGDKVDIWGHLDDVIITAFKILLTYRYSIHLRFDHGSHYNEQALTEIISILIFNLNFKNKGHLDFAIHNKISIL